MLTSARKIWEIFDGRTKMHASILLMLMLIGALAEALSIGMVFPLVEIALAPDNAKDNFFINFVVEELSISPKESAGILFGSALAFFLIKNAYLLWLVHRQGLFIWGTLSALWMQLYKRYLFQSYEFHVERNTSELVNNVTITLRNMFYSFIMPIINLTTEIFIASSICILLLYSAPLVTFFSFLILISLVLFYFFGLRRPLGRWGKDQIDEQRKMILWLNQGMGGIKEIKIAGFEDFFLNKFKSASQRVARFSRYNLFVTQMPRYLAEAVIISSILIIVYYVGVIQRSVQEALPLMAMFSMAAFRLLPAVSRIASYLGQISFGGAALNTIHRDLTGGIAVAAEAQTTSSMAFNSGLLIDDVSFRYAGAQSNALNNVSIEIPRGASIALVGPSGAGKTTLADLILGLYQPTKGTIRADSADIRSNPAGWREVVSCIPQKVFILDSPVWANIALGQTYSEINKKKLSQVITQSQLDSTVEEMPEGINTIVGEGGARISGGQAQRIGIARSLYADADILIMDEATSALDSETEHAFAEVIKSIKGEKTLIMIAHRLSTVRYCDRLFYMKDGRIVDSGSFEELYEKNIEFREMVRKMDVSVA